MLVAPYVLFPSCKSETKSVGHGSNILKPAKAFLMLPAVGYHHVRRRCMHAETYSGQPSAGQKYHLNDKLSIAPDRIVPTVTALHIDLASEYRVREDGALSCTVYAL